MKRPHAERCVKDGPPIAPAMRERLVTDCRTICQVLGYDMNTVECAVQGGVPYAIDFLNPAPDADYHSVGEENIFWFSNAILELTVEKAREKPQPLKEYRWSHFLHG